MRVADILFGRFPPPPPVGAGRVNLCDKPGEPMKFVAGPRLIQMVRRTMAAKAVEVEPKKVSKNTLLAREKKQKTLAAIRAGYDSTTKISSRTGIADSTVLKYADELAEEGLIEIVVLPPGFKVRRYRVKREE